MAETFANDSGDRWYWALPSSGVTMPFCMHAWAYEGASADRFISMGNSASDQYCDLSSTSGDLLQARLQDLTGSASSQGSTKVANTWESLVGLYEDDGPTLWVDGSAKTKDDNVASWQNDVGDTLDRISVGVSADNSPVGDLDGEIAECAIWENTTLTQGEIDALAAGVAPFLVRPSGLIFYAPFIGQNGSGNPDVIGYATLSSAGTTTSFSHPRIIKKSRGSF